MPGSRDFQQGDIWGNGDEDNPGTFDVGLEDGWEWYWDDRYVGRREIEVETKEECLAATVAHKTEGKLLSFAAGKL